MPRKSLEELKHALGHRFKQPELLELALTHSSFAHEQNLEAVEDNERLEFLGDSVLGFLISGWLYQARPDLKEGELSRLKSFLVSAANLLQYGERLSLGDYLELGKGEEKTGGRQKQALLVDSFEAVLAAVYLDGGLDAVFEVVRRLFGDQIKEIEEGSDPVSNFKSALQEELQSHGRGVARYRVVEETGPDHEPLFTVDVLIDGDAVASGNGATKKAAEQAAAMRALEVLKDEGVGGSG
jgi:ribonuclease-3